MAVNILARIIDEFRTGTTESLPASVYAAQQGLVRRQPDELDRRLCAQYDAQYPGAGYYRDDLGRVVLTRAPAQAW